MDAVGIHWPFFLAQVVNLVICVGWPTLAILTLLALRRRSLAESVRVMWALIIVVVPLLGALAFWIVNPKE
jgi:uncharacterized membrane protein